METLRALSVRQPWAHAIVHMGKDVENRPRCNSHRGLLLIHASGHMKGDEYRFARRFMERNGLGPERLPDRDAIQKGGIIGVVEMTDCVERSTSPWWMGGPRGFALRRARPLPFIHCKGTVTPLVWTPPPAVRERVAEALRDLDLV